MPEPHPTIVSVIQDVGRDVNGAGRVQVVAPTYPTR